MKVLVIKTSSMGDIIHTLPALTDAMLAIPGIQFDWVVEEAFQEIPRWHKAVNTVIPVAIRRWRKNLFRAYKDQELHQFVNHLRQKKYDLVIDAQGLLKSILVTILARGKKYGYDWSSAREHFASCFYDKKYAVSWEQHAVKRSRELFSKIFQYKLPTSVPDYGIQQNLFLENTDTNYLLLLHGTTWATKHWPETYWKALVEKASHVGWKIKLPWGNPAELERANRLAENNASVEVLPKKTISELAKIILNAKAIVAMDTGLGHLAAALEVPTISLYGPTDPNLTGALGKSQIHIRAEFPCAPCKKDICQYQGPRVVEPACFGTITPDKVWEQLMPLLKGTV